MDSIKVCECAFTGFVGKVICVKHLEEAFNLAMSWKDTELASIIALKAARRI